MKMTNKQICVSAAVCGVVAVVAVGSYFLFSDKGPDVNLNDKTQLKNYMTSDEFRDLPEEKQRKFFRKLRGNEFQKRLDEYTRLDEQQKREYLDKFIDKMEQRRKEIEKKKGADAARKEMKRRMDPERMRARSEMKTPEQRAQRAEFFNDLKKRMEERGTDSPFK